MGQPEKDFIDPMEIERELGEIWATINRQEGAASAVTRASMSNVMIVCDGEEQALDAADRIPRLVQHHPARVLVLALMDDDPDETVKAWVTSHCRRTSDGTQLCAEHIELRFPESHADRAASIVRSLLISDLPCALWWLSPRPPALTGVVFDAFASMANQIIYDSVGWADPPAGVRAMTRWSKNHRTVIFNLAWRRLKPWRRILSQSLCPAVLPGALTRINAIEVHHGPHALPLVWLMLGWLASRLGWQPKKGVVRSSSEMMWLFTSPTGPIEITVHRRADGPSRIEQMRIGWLGADGLSEAHAEYRHEGHHIRYFPGDPELRPSSIPTMDRRLEQMVAAQLAHRAGDQLFTASIVFSEAMAKVIEGQSPPTRN